MHISNGIPTKGFLSIDRESDTMYFDGKHLSDVLRDFYEQEVEITIWKLPVSIGKCPRLIELCNLRDEFGNCTHNKLCMPIKDCFSCHCATCNREFEPCYSCEDFSNWIAPQGYKDI